MKKLLIGLVLALATTLVQAEDQLLFPQACEVNENNQSVDCEVWFNKSPDGRIDSAFVRSQSLTVDLLPYSEQDAISEFWLIDSVDLGRKEKKAFIDGLSTLISSIATNAKGILVHQIHDGKGLVYNAATRPSKAQLFEKFDDELELDKNKQDTASYVNQFAQTLLSNMEIQGVSRGVFYLVTSRNLDGPKIEQISQILNSLGPDNVRLVIIPFTADDTDLTQNTLLALAEKTAGERLDLVDFSKPKAAQNTASAINTRLLENGGYLSLNYGDLCAAGRLEIGDATGQTYEQVLQFPDCPRPLTECEKDPRSDACLSEQYQNCQITPEQGNCQSVILEYCDVNPNTSGCYSTMLNYCRLNPHVEKYNCSSKVLSYCRNNQNDADFGCPQVLVEECKSSPKSGACPQRLFEYCDFNLKDPECNSWVTNYCSDNPNLAGCNKVLAESCWTNQDAPGCRQRLFDECSAKPTLVGCNDVLLEQCQSDPSLPQCQEVMLSYCDSNPNSEGCSERLTNQCLIDATPSRCDNLLATYCWSNQGENICEPRLFELCEADPQSPDCATVLLDRCEANPEIEGCGNWAGLHCEMEGEHGYCVERKKQLQLIIGIAIGVLVLILIGLFIRMQSKKIPRKLGNVFLFEKRQDLEDSVEHQLTLKQNWIGRADECEVMVNDSSMSKIHAQILYRDGEFYLSDMQSLNGVFLNQQKVDEEVQIKTGNLIRMGNTTFRFEIYASSDK